MVPILARRVTAFAPRSIDFEDLVSVGNLGLLYAATRYRPRKHGGTPFEAYARLRIYGAMVDSFRGAAYREEKRLPLASVPEQAAWDRIEEAIDCDRQLAAIAAAVETLDPRLRMVMKRHYAGERLREIGNDCGVSKSRVSHLHLHAVRTLRLQLAT